MIEISGKSKTMLGAAFLILGGTGCICLFIFGYVINSSKVHSPTASITGVVIRYVPGKRTPPTRQSDSCTYAYKVDEETYTLNSTCGSLPGDRDGDKAEIIYSVDDPRDAYVNRQFFFNLIGCLGIPILIIGLLLVRKAAGMHSYE